MMQPMIYLKDVVTLKVDQEKCVGCGMCVLVCPREVLSLANSRIEITSRDACIECGACAQNCPVDALSVRPGVGCATALIHSMLGKKGSCCGKEDSGCSCEIASESSPDAPRSSCC